MHRALETPETEQKSFYETPKWMSKGHSRHESIKSSTYKKEYNPLE